MRDTDQQKVLLYITGSYTQYLVTNYNGIEYDKGYIYVSFISLYVNHFVVHQKLTQQCKSALLKERNRGTQWPVRKRNWMQDQREEGCFNEASLLTLSNFLN